MASISSLGGVNQQQFLQLFITQLQNQNPLEPISDRDLVTQLAQFSTLQGIERLNASFSDLLQLQQLTQGSELIGRTITFQESGSTQTQRGVVSSLSVDNGSILLRVGTKSVPLANVRSVEPTP